MKLSLRPVNKPQFEPKPFQIGTVLGYYPGSSKSRPLRRIKTKFGFFGTRQNMTRTCELPESALQGQRRTRKTSKRKMKLFLQALAHTGNVSRSCKAAGVQRSLAYEWRNEIPEFRSAWDGALETYADLLEQELDRRGREGWEEPVVYQGKQCWAWVDEAGQPCTPDNQSAQRVPLVIRRFSDTCLLARLKAERPEKYKEYQPIQANTNISLTQNIIQQRTLEFDAMYDQLLADQPGIQQPLINDSRNR